MTYTELVEQYIISKDFIKRRIYKQMNVWVQANLEAVLDMQIGII